MSQGLGTWTRLPAKRPDPGIAAWVGVAGAVLALGGGGVLVATQARIYHAAGMPSWLAVGSAVVGLVLVLGLAVLASVALLARDWGAGLLFVWVNGVMALWFAAEPLLAGGLGWARELLLVLLALALDVALVAAVFTLAYVAGWARRLSRAAETVP